MWMNGWWGPFPLLWIFPLIFLVVALPFIFRHTRESEPTAREILDRRYARGEIGREAYQ